MWAIMARRSHRCRSSSLAPSLSSQGRRFHNSRNSRRVTPSFHMQVSNLTHKTSRVLCACYAIRITGTATLPMAASLFTMAMHRLCILMLRWVSILVPTTAHQVRATIIRGRVIPRLIHRRHHTPIVAATTMRVATKEKVTITTTPTVGSLKCIRV